MQDLNLLVRARLVWNRMLLGEPSTQIDQATPIAAERTIR